MRLIQLEVEVYHSQAPAETQARSQRHEQVKSLRHCIHSATPSLFAVYAVTVLLCSVEC
jgi:hypothetical protein